MKKPEDYTYIEDVPARVHKKHPNIVIFRVSPDQRGLAGKDAPFWMETPNPDFAQWIVDNWNDESPKQQATIMNGLRRAAAELESTLGTLAFQKAQKEKYG